MAAPATSGILTEDSVPCPIILEKVTACLELLHEVWLETSRTEENDSAFPLQPTSSEQVAEVSPSAIAMGPLLLPLLPSLLLCVVIAIILIRKPRNRLPPGPPGLPLIGHLHLLGTQPHRSLADLSKRYGSLMFMRFGHVPVLVASNPDAARLILKSHDQIFSSRSIPSVSAIFFEGKDLLFSQPGPYFKFVRRLVTSDLLSVKRLQSFRPIITEGIRSLLHTVTDNADCVHLRSKLHDATFNIISRITLNREARDMWSSSQSDPSSSLKNLLLESIDLLGVLSLADYIPMLARMDLQGCARRGKACSTKMKAVWREIIDERRKTRLARGSESQDVDFLDVLLSASSQDDVHITDLGVMAILTNMFAAGIDTSTVTVEWALAELLVHPHILQKAQDELEAVVGSTRLIRESDIPDLPYLTTIVKETMRLHPVLPLLVPHTTMQDCQVSGYDIPRTTQAYVNVWAIGRDPSVWDDPLLFLPERFLASDVDVRGQHFELLPFGSGRRACPGLALGLSNVHLMLANLLNAFSWEKLGEVDLSEKFGIVMTLANPLVVKATLKVPTHVIDGKDSHEVPICTM
ncbi:hypothetical protein KP509_33G043100 [Ceratopteris richardii]|uniref:Cytochrome P450 n=1 Tax=Ceratopteris richardii TaxID=49495 RepID=A0A8T2QQT8_CERRI|nr:hypothetical protein KP509_33G043100 [Ceratopteris richardii]